MHGWSHHGAAHAGRRPRRARGAIAVVAVVVAALAAVASRFGVAAFGDGAPPALPSSCAAGPSTASIVTSHPHLTYHPSSPVKDLGIQPLQLTRPQWQSLLALAKRAGAGIVNAGVSWASLEPRGPHEDSGLLTTLREFVNDARSQGMAVRFQLFGFPQWARDRGDSSATWLAPARTDELSRWSAWLHSLVAAFNGRVEYFEIWNEENSSNFWPSGPNPESYAGLLACSYVTIKGEDPAAAVISGGLSTNDVGYLQHLYQALRSYPDAASSNDFFDLLGAHPYSGGRSPAVDASTYVTQDQWGLDDTNFLGFEQLHQAMAAEGEGWKQIYIGEYGAPTNAEPPVDADGFARVAEVTRAKWLSLSFTLAASTREVFALSWYTFYPDAYDGADWAIVLPKGAAAETTSWQLTPTYRALAGVTTP